MINQLKTKFMIFNDIENPDNKDKKLTFLERMVIKAGISVAKAILWKAKRARTYGDVMKLSDLIGSKIEAMENKYGEKGPSLDTPEQIKEIIKEVSEIKEEIKT
jgi:hypothetical protein